MEMTVTFLATDGHKWPQMTATNDRDWAQYARIKDLMLVYDIFIWQFGKYLFIYYKLLTEKEIEVNNPHLELNIWQKFPIHFRLTTTLSML